MKRVLALALLLFCAHTVHAQGAAYTAGPFNQSGYLWVCPVPSGGNPCPSPSNIFTNVALNAGLSNPVFISQGQTVSFYVSPGQYTIQFPTGSYSQVVTIGGGLGGVTTFNTRNGAVVPTSGDYTCAQTTGCTAAGLIAPNINATNLSPNCSTQTNCLPITSGKIVNDGVWTNNSATVTSATAGFTAAMNGWSIFGTAGGCVTGTAQEMSGITQLPIGTLTFVNATTVTTSVTTSTITTVASGGCLIFGPIADTQIAAADTAWQSASACSQMVIDAGVFLIATAHFITKPTTCRPLGNDSAYFGQGAQVGGQGKGSTIFVPIDGFNFSTCTGGQSAHACMNGMQASWFHDFSVFGGNNSRTGKTASPASVFFEVNAYSATTNLYLAAFGASDTGLTGFSSNNNQSTSAYISDSTIDGIGGGTTLAGMATIPANGLVAQNFVVQNCLTNCLNIGLTGGITCTYCNWEGGAGSLNNTTLVINLGVYKGRFDFCIENGAPAGSTVNCFKNGSNVSSAAKAYLDNVSFGENVNTSSLGVDNWGTIWSDKSIFYSGSAGTSINIEPTGIWHTEQDQITGTLGINQVAGGQIIADGHSLLGTCTGTANASVTNSLYGTGPNITATTCAGQTATLGTGIVANGPRTLAMLSCDSSATTVSVACTLMKNGVATAATCTMTAATHCVDWTDRVTFVNTDLISMKIVTGAAETGANIKALAVWY